MANGSRHAMYYIAEATYGTTPATPALKYFRHNSTTLAMAKNTLQSEEIRPNRQIVDFRMGTGQTGGEVVSELVYSDLDDFLSSLMMSAWASNVLKVGTTRSSYTIVRRFEDLGGTAPNNKNVQIFVGQEVNTMSLSVTTEAIVQMTLGFVGKGMTLAAANPTGATLGAAGTNLAMDSFTGTITEGGTAIAVITEIQLQVENGIEPRFVVGSRDSIRPSSGKCTVTGTLTAYFEDSYLLSKFIDETVSSIEFSLFDAAAGNSLKFTIPRVKYTGGQTDVSGDGPITISLPFQATYDSTAASTLTITRTPKA